MSDVVLVLLYILLFILLIASYIIAGFGLTFIFGAPYVGTPKRIGRDMLKLADLKPGETFADFGSGSGTLLLLAVQEFGAGKAIGYEINPTLVFWTKLRARFAGVSDKIEVRRANFFKIDLEPADVVGLYLLNPTMDNMLLKLKNQMPNGARVVARSFPFHAIKPNDQKTSNASTLFLYLLK